MRIKLLCLLFSISSFCFAQDRPAPKLETHGLLWKISGNGLPKPSYLFGTMHTSNAVAIIDSIKGFDYSFNSVDQLVCEILKRQGSDSSTNFSFSQAFVKPWSGDSTYAQLLTVSERSKLDYVLSEFKLLHLIKHNASPFLIMSYIRWNVRIKNEQTSILSSRKTSARRIVLDDSLCLKANRLKMKILELESKTDLSKSMDLLYSYFPKLSYKRQIRILMNYIENYEKLDLAQQAHQSDLLCDYLNQRVSSLRKNEVSVSESYFDFSKSEYEKLSTLYDDIVLCKRNDNWMKKIPGIISQKSTFIAVGAAHLPGEGGLINQLRQLSYTVERVE